MVGAAAAAVVTDPNAAMNVVYEHRLGVAYEADVVDGFELGHGPVEHEQLERLGVADPEKVGLRVIVQVSDFQYAGGDGAELLLP